MQNTFSLVNRLKQCASKRDLQAGRELHLEAAHSGLHTSKYVATALVTMYAKCANMFQAQCAFNNAHKHDVVLWTSLILGYVENGQNMTAIDLFLNLNCEPDAFTFATVIKALASEKELSKEFRLVKGICFHRECLERGFADDIFVGSALVDMYSKCHSVVHSQTVFNSMSNKNVISWTSLILGYVENGEMLKALELFRILDCQPNDVTFVAVFKACSCLASEKLLDKLFCLEKGINIHKECKTRELTSGLFVSSALLDMYSKCGSMRHARQLFVEMSSRDVVSWNTLLLGYAENGESREAIELFTRMDCQPNTVTFMAVLKACGELAALGTGEEVHARIRELGLEQDQVVANSLVDFYGRCGVMPAAKDVFDRMHSKDVVSWTALIGGYSSVGDTDSVFSLVKGMQEGGGVQMNGITFLFVLKACSHRGLVEEGKECFESMAGHGVSPTMEHFTCMVDMLGRANRLQEALAVIRSMPFEGDTVIWRTLLGACHKWNNVEVGEIAFDALVAGDERDGLAYVMMSDIYKKLSKEKP